MTHAFSSLDELGEGPGFRKVRGALGITAFGVNGVVYPPGFPGISHYHDTQDELYFVHSGTAKVEVDGEERILGPGGLFHAESTTPCGPITMFCSSKTMSGNAVRSSV